MAVRARNPRLAVRAGAGRISSENHAAQRFRDQRGSGLRKEIVGAALRRPPCFPISMGSNARETVQWTVSSENGSDRPRRGDAKRRWGTPFRNVSFLAAPPYSGGLQPKPLGTSVCAQRAQERSYGFCVQAAQKKRSSVPHFGTTAAKTSSDLAALGHLPLWGRLLGRATPLLRGNAAAALPWAKQTRGVTDG